MKYKVFFHQSPNHSTVYANGIVEAQRVAAETLKDLQRENALVGWTIKTVVEDHG